MPFEGNSHFRWMSHIVFHHALLFVIFTYLNLNVLNSIYSYNFPGLDFFAFSPFSHFDVGWLLLTFHYFASGCRHIIEKLKEFHTIIFAGWKIGHDANWGIKFKQKQDWEDCRLCILHVVKINANFLGEQPTCENWENVREPKLWKSKISQLVPQYDTNTGEPNFLPLS